MTKTPDILQKICDYKAIEVAKAKADKPINVLENELKTAPPVRGFMRSLEDKSKTGFALIAEIKKASPSKGLIRPDFDPPNLAKAYEKGGAACLSVLTDGPSFEGKDEYLIAARNACTLPAIRKDFMIDTYQIVESRALGADAILIILACLGDVLAKELFDTATSLGMDSLIETHDEKEMERALKMGGKLLGVNNRDLRTFATDLAITERLAPMVPNDAILVAESGLNAHQDLKRMAKCGARAFLVGESLMRQTDVTKATYNLLNG